MRLITRAALTLSLLVIMLVGFWSIYHLTDSKLSAEAKALFESPPIALSDEAKKGFRFLLGWDAPKGVDPIVFGEEKYNQLRQTKFGSPDLKETLSATDAAMQEAGSFCGEHGDQPELCAKEMYVNDREKIQAFLELNSQTLTRFDEWIKMGSFGRDLESDLAKSNSILEVLMIWKTKRLQLTARIRDGQLSGVLSEMAAIHSFFVRSIEAPLTYLEASILLAIIKSNRRLLQEAITEFPDLKSELKSRDSSETAKYASLNLKIDAKTLTERVKKEEAIFFRKIMELVRNEDISFTQLNSLSDPSEGAKPSSLLDKLLAFTLRPNETLNTYAESVDKLNSPSCIVPGETAPSKTCTDEYLKARGTWLVNPTGYLLLGLYQASPQSIIARFERETVSINTPIHFEQ